MTALPRPLVLGVAAFGLAGALAGCATTTGSTDTGSSGSDSGSDSSSDSGSTSSAGYKDGSYTATGEYQSPGGNESIEVTLTLADSKVTKAEVVPHASSGNAKQYQTQFSEGISGEVVGKSLDELSVTRVSGSSLTSRGFNDAVDQIKHLSEL
ncbi:FMN-binding protein [Schumannella sp. 10F1B-5-1]|uniref:FMN-binding protein n=1 Tax=Schumannella sp. 10F1B-5-1 TaxID=2590780 RepID=UPI001130A41B|nr:FMN-binding protein [Schumannella sp. 10F1B-5-1]TPW72773.1 FMN-binding protein [Schumannella sp. 10F1B-5-1]